MAREGWAGGGEEGMARWPLSGKGRPLFSLPDFLSLMALRLAPGGPLPALCGAGSRRPY